MSFVVDKHGNIGTVLITNTKNTGIQLNNLHPFENRLKINPSSDILLFQEPKQISIIEREAVNRCMKTQKH